MKKISILILVLLVDTVCAQPEFSSISSKPGTFSRMGFGARGMGMANAMSAVLEGNVVSYYNPALSAFQNGNSIQTSYSFLSLDRSLNFLSFTRKFEFGTTEKNNKPRSVAGVSVGVINAGVSGIEERDNQGIKSGDISTSENQFFLGLSNRFSEKFALGVNIKFYYFKLYTDISSTSLGFDIGGIYKFSSNLTLSFSVADINSKYKWDTTDLYGQDGNNTEDKFPVLKKIGVSYKLEDPKLIIAIEFENSNAQTNFLRFGAEYNIFDKLYLRGGLDKFNLSNFDFPVRPSIGFSYFQIFDSWIIGVDYAFIIEPFSSHDQHILGVNINL